MDGQAEPDIAPVAMAGSMDERETGGISVEVPPAMTGADAVLVTEAAAPARHARPDLAPEPIGMPAAAQPAVAVQPGAVPDAEERARERLAELRARAHHLVAHLDVLLARTLDAILHHPAFQAMESRWRGLHWLIATTDDPMVKVRMLDVRWTEIARDLERALDFDQSALFDLVYSQEFGMPGGEPYGLMVIDHAVSHRIGKGASKIDDVAVLEGLGDIAAASFCPFIVGGDPVLLGLDSLGDIDLRQEIDATFADPAYARWTRMRARPDSRFLGLVMPRLLVRPLHRGRDHPRLGFVYDERAASGEDLLWLNGGFALAHVTARAMNQHRWPAAIRGTVPKGEGGLVHGPARQPLPSDRNGVVARFALENALSEEQEIAMNEAGMIVIRHLHLTGMAAFLNLPTLHKPPHYGAEAARMNAKMGAMLNYILCVARFAHYIKVMARDWIGKYQTADQCESLLQRWLSTYVTGNDDASPEMRLRYPLREGRVTVSEIPERPGSFGCEVAIRPHYQLDQISSEFRLTTAISSGRGD
jgi:type VI secretion system ImpC/EvpB family protein